MSKKLTPRKALQNLTEYLTGDYRDCFEELSVIETALKENAELKKIKLLPYPKVNDEEYRRSVIKSLQVLEIIKEIIPIEEEDFFYDKETDTYFFIGYRVSKKQFELLKEVLL